METANILDSEETQKILDETYHKHISEFEHYQIPDPISSNPATIIMKKICPQQEGTCSILTITIKDEEKRLTSKNLIYESYSVHPDDPVIKEYIARALKDFGSEPSDIRIRINLEI
jgi:hypothetical protein